METRQQAIQYASSIIENRISYLRLQINSKINEMTSTSNTRSTILSLFPLSKIWYSINETSEPISNKTSHCSLI